MKSLRSILKVPQTLNPVIGVRYISGKWTKQKEGSPPGVLTSTQNISPVVGVTVPEFLFQNLHKWENAPAMVTLKQILLKTYTLPID